MTRFRLGLLSLVLIGSSHGLLAEERPAERIQEAYRKTKTAESLDDYRAIIDLLEQARDGELSNELDRYALRLLGWARNKRGERYVQQAADASRREDADQAARLDALALAEFEAAIQHDPTRWKAYHNRGVSLGLQRRYEDALADFTKVIELQPDYANAWFNRGEIHYELGRLDEALKDYGRAIELDDADHGAYTSRGHTHFQLGQHRLALNDYEHAVRLQPKDADARVNRGEAYQSLGMWEKAAADVKRAVELAPDSARAYQAAAWLMATCPEASIRNPELAVETAEKSIELGEKDARSLNVLAAALANAERWNEAQETILEAIAAADKPLRAELEKRLEQYRREEPFRQATLATAQAAP